MVLPSGLVRDARASVVGTKGDGVLIWEVVWNPQTALLGIWPWAELYYLVCQQLKACVGDTCLPLETHPMH